MQRSRYSGYSRAVAVFHTAGANPLTDLREIWQTGEAVSSPLPHFAKICLKTEKRDPKNSITVPFERSNEMYRWYASQFYTMSVNKVHIRFLVISRLWYLCVLLLCALYSSWLMPTVSNTWWTCSMVVRCDLFSRWKLGKKFFLVSSFHHYFRSSVFSTSYYHTLRLDRYVIYLLISIIVVVIVVNCCWFCCFCCC